MPKISFIFLFMLCFSVFGEKTSEKNKQVVQEKVQPEKDNQGVQIEVQSRKSQAIPVKTQTGENKKSSQAEIQPKEGNPIVQEKVQPGKDDQEIQIKAQPETNKTPDLPAESTEPLTYHEALEKYKNTAQLEWFLGLGYSDIRALWAPLALEIHIPMEVVSEKLTWLFQAGGMLVVVPPRRTSYRDDSGRFNTSFISGGTLGTSVFQTGFKYKFSRGAYGSFKIGPVGLLTESFPPPLWKGGMFFGFGNDILMVELGVQSFYFVEKNLWDFGIFFNMGSVIRKWWSRK